MLRDLRVLYDVGSSVGLTDRQLLERFQSASRADDHDVAESALTALVERHAAMVWNVCRSIIRDRHDVEDAFQATFLILVRKAGSLLVGDTLGPWLHVVAGRTALSVRKARARRQAVERPGADSLPEAIEPTVYDPSWHDADGVRAAIHAEIMKLPESFRAVIVLCDLEGLSYSEATLRLKIPLGTVQSRLARARRRLRRGLIQRGIHPSDAAGGDRVSMCPDLRTDDGPWAPAGAGREGRPAGCTDRFRPYSIESDRGRLGPGFGQRRSTNHVARQVEAHPRHDPGWRPGRRGPACTPMRGPDRPSRMRPGGKTGEPNRREESRNGSKSRARPAQRLVRSREGPALSARPGSGADSPATRREGHSIPGGRAGNPLGRDHRRDRSPTSSEVIDPGQGESRPHSDRPYCRVELKRQARREDGSWLDWENVDITREPQDPGQPGRNGPRAGAQKVPDGCDR